MSSRDHSTGDAMTPEEALRNILKLVEDQTRLKMLTRCKFFCRASRHWLRRDWGVRIDAPKFPAFDFGALMRLSPASIAEQRQSAVTLPLQ
jgi:hypothetical protein